MGPHCQLPRVNSVTDKITINAAHPAAQEETAIQICFLLVSTQKEELLYFGTSMIYCFTI